MEYVAGPVIALLLGMKFTAFSLKKTDNKLAEIEAKITEVGVRLDASETEMPKKLIATITPVAAAVKRLNEQVGI